RADAVRRGHQRARSGDDRRGPGRDEGARPRRDDHDRRDPRDGLRPQGGRPRGDDGRGHDRRGGKAGRPVLEPLARAHEDVPLQDHPLTDANGTEIEWPWLDRVAGSTPRHLGGRAVVGGRGMVVAPQPLAAQAGLATLRAGGNAVDAAVATSAVLMVTVPMQTGPGGDAIWLVRPPGGPAVVVNGSGGSGARLDVERAHEAAARGGERG